MRTIIGLNVDIDGGDRLQARVNCNYYEAIRQSGGLPILLPLLSEPELDLLLPELQGVLFIGSRDYSPRLYGETPSEQLVPLNEQRQSADLLLMRKVLQTPRMPVLSICGGMQLLNINRHGSLHQDIATSFPDSMIKHRSDEGLCWHQVYFKPGSLLSNIYQDAGAGLSVVASHHQAVKRLGTGLQATARTVDGIVEAIELPGRAFTVGVQWHPEHDYQGNKPLFDAFVAAAASNF